MRQKGFKELVSVVCLFLIKTTGVNKLPSTKMEQIQEHLELEMSM